MLKLPNAISVLKKPETELYLSVLRYDIEHIFFMPTKYRVYYRYINDHGHNNGKALPDGQWQYVQSNGQEFGITTRNLTPALIEESGKLLAQGILTFWRGDTHRNKHGTAVAADIVNRALFSHH